MDYSNDPISVVLQIKTFKTNQLNQFKKFLQHVDPKANVSLIQKKMKLPLHHLCQSSTFMLTCSSLDKLKVLFQHIDLKENKFFVFDFGNLECIVLGGSYQGQVLDFFQIQSLLQFNLSKVNMLGALSKRPKVLRVLKHVLARLIVVLKANNGN
jgi:hypothetical protein